MTTKRVQSQICQVFFTCIVVLNANLCTGACVLVHAHQITIACFAVFSKTSSNFYSRAPFAVEFPPLTGSPPTSPTRAPPPGMACILQKATLERCSQAARLLRAELELGTACALDPTVYEPCAPSRSLCFEIVEHELTWLVSCQQPLQVCR